MSIFKVGRFISTLEEWEKYAPPKSPHHWVDGRSAKEVARVWLAGRATLPSEVSTALAAHSAFGDVLSWKAEPEARLRFDSFPGEPRNSDLLVDVSDAAGSYVLAVEAKADEPYGETVSQAVANGLERRIENPRSNAITRVEELVRSLLPLRSKGLPHVGSLRYQLLTACAGALAEAKRKRSSRAVVLVHEFVTDETNDENHARNAMDLAAFVRRLSSGEVDNVQPGRMYGPYSTPGTPEVGLFLIKVVRQLRSVGIRDPL